MQPYKKFGALTSSVDPQQFSLAWGSLIQMLTVVAAGFLAYKGVDAKIANDQVQQAAQSLTIIGTSLIATWHAGQTVLGIVRRWFNKDPQ